MGNSPEDFSPTRQDASGECTPENDHEAQTAEDETNKSNRLSLAKALRETLDETEVDEDDQQIVIK